MKDPESRTIFAGVDGRTDTELPECYRQRRGNADTVTFAEAVRDLPQAVETTVTYQNPFPTNGLKRSASRARRAESSSGAGDRRGG